MPPVICFRSVLLAYAGFLGATAVFEATAVPQSVAAPQQFSLGDRVQIALSKDWVQRTDISRTPLPALASSAPKMVFSDFLVIENRTAPALLEMGLSSNPLIGSDPSSLDLRIGRDLLPGLFYFFYPPPRGCLARGSAAITQARNQQLEELLKLPQEERTSAARPPIVIRQVCDFAPATVDFFASRLSPAAVFRDSDSETRVQGEFNDFYRSPMQQVESDGKIFYIFEASASSQLESATVQRFGLPDNRQGATVHFFWVIGARSPFPFVLDPLRKDLEILHVSYACLDFGGDCRTQFLTLLGSIQYNP